ncbi:MAG: transcription elongation factor GreA [Candidatus Taylorbacteria bacterium]|nr:transcription elongation factor GreA [Candidatus Taylorbacteria bacterium]
MSEVKQYLTSEKMQEFKKELSFLKTDKRKQVAENLEYTKKLGDLAENAEYHDARQIQAEVEDRISHLENLLKTAVIVDGNDSFIREGMVSIGSNVKIQKDGEKDLREYKIVGSEEADMAQGKVSNLSPLGASLLGKKKGDKIEVNTPKGKVVYSLLSV